MPVVPAVTRILLPMILVLPIAAFGQESTRAESEDAVPSYLRDRGTGVRTSIFGTYVRPGELVAYPFFEYYRDRNAEYSPSDFGYTLDRDFRGDFEASEYLIFLSYGLSRNVSLELEAAGITAELEKASDDPTSRPQEVTESGLGDVQTQVNWVWQHETSGRPELFSYSEVVFPFQRNKAIIGTSDWEFKVGTGVTRGFSIGTLTLRAAAEYAREEGKVGMGEVAVEYLKRLSPTWSVFGAVEGSEDEWELITEAQVRVTNRVTLKLNSGFGLTSKATGWAPETGVLFRF